MGRDCRDQRRSEGQRENHLQIFKVTEEILSLRRGGRRVYVPWTLYWDETTTEQALLPHAEEGSPEDKEPSRRESRMNVRASSTVGPCVRINVGKLNGPSSSWGAEGEKVSICDRPGHEIDAALTHVPQPKVRSDAVESSKHRHNVHRTLPE